MLDTVAYWCVAYTGPNAEEKADVALRAENYATWFPRTRVRKQVAKRGRPGQFVIDWFDVPAFPRYVFFGVRPQDSFQRAIHADGVAMVLKSDETPLIVPHGVMDELMGRADSDGIMGRVDQMPPRKELKEGTAVHFKKNSPLEGFLAIVEKDTGKKVRLWLKAHGKEQRMTVDASMVYEV